MARTALTAPQPQGRPWFTPQRKPGPGVMAYHRRVTLAGDRRGFPGERPLDPLVVESAEPDQRSQEIAVQAMRDTRRRRRGPDPPEKLNPPLDAWACRSTYSQPRAILRIGSVSPELVEEDERPDRARVLRRVADPRLDPPALGVLLGDDRRRSGRSSSRPGRPSTTSGSSSGSVQRARQGPDADGGVAGSSSQGSGSSFSTVRQSSIVAVMTTPSSIPDRAAARAAAQPPTRTTQRPRARPARIPSSAVSSPSRSTSVTASPRAARPEVGRDPLPEPASLLDRELGGVDPQQRRRPAG